MRSGFSASLGSLCRQMLRRAGPGTQTKSSSLLELELQVSCDASLTVISTKRCISRSRPFLCSVSFPENGAFMSSAISSTRVPRRTSEGTHGTHGGTLESIALLRYTDTNTRWCSVTPSSFASPSQPEVSHQSSLSGCPNISHVTSHSFPGCTSPEISSFSMCKVCASASREAHSTIRSLLCRRSLMQTSMTNISSGCKSKKVAKLTQALMNHLWLSKMRALAMKRQMATSQMTT
mmetsp:Transcript_67778/g.161747  ORF Transcript_67778/g.161747 Transcript_67778/m.161747 type:complete len:235 (+) Transcript_67778:561-1265(+)